MSDSLLEEIPEQIYSSIEGYFDRMEFRLRCRDGIVSNYFTKGRGAVLSDFVINPNESLHICVPRDGIIFKNNTAFNLGGVAYLGGNTTLEFMNACSETVFKGNTAVGISNSIHMLDLTNIIFSIEEGSKVQMYDALSDEISNSDTSAATLEVKGLGEFNLRKTSIIKGTNLKLDALFKLKEGANLAGKSIENKRMFSTIDGEVNTVEVESFKNDGKIEMEVWREGDNDSIKTKDVEIEENSVLKIVANSRRFDKRTYKMLEYTGDCSGKFKYVEMDESFGKVKSVNYEHNGIFVTLEGKGIGTKFRNMKDLTRNQKSLAIAYDNISKTSTGEMDKIIEKIDLLSIYNQEATKKLFTETSGYFLANMIRNGTRDEGKRLIDERMEEREQNKNPEVWGKAEWNYVENKEDEKKEGDCIDRNITGIIGYDKVIKKDKYDDKFMLLGGFVKISEHNVKQGKNNEGKLVKSGIGFIGKVEGKKREIRAIVDGSYDIYDTKRCVRFEAYNRGEFEEVEEVNRIEGKFRGSDKVKNKEEYNS
ncbi:hypothetical protein [Candidatus Endomicrobiellum devescovinae]|uniref:hypothetical protein n=1 Tax=Candidatus Endomicrobiellum devescovinae TaxID=3242322 RepID=UPI002830C1E0|nr:hypothetical protein [Endomicrobium sp.]